LPDFFISYAREDGPFVDRLRAALIAREREVWVDRSPQLGAGIEPGDNWRTSTEEGIARSEAFVFVLSDSSARSEPCRGELAHAVAVNKRLLPICLEEPADEALVPIQIRDLSWVMMRPADSFDAGVAALIRALDTDIEVVRQHTRLLIRARAWELGNRRSSPLLRGAELRTAEDWLSRAATAGAPPTESQREFIVASRRAATRRQRIAVGGALAVAGVAVGLSIFALVQRAHAVHESDVAFARQLDANAQNSLATDPELSVLLADRSAHVVPDQGRGVLETALSESNLRYRYDLVRADAPGDVLWNPAGDRVLITSPALGGAAQAEIYQPGSGAQSISLPGPTDHNSSGWDASGNRVLIGGNHPAVYDASTGKLVARVPGPAAHAALSPDGTEVVSTDGDATGHVIGRVYDITTRRVVTTFHPAYTSAVTCFALSPDGKYVAQCDAKAVTDPDSPGELDIWSTATGRLVRSIHTPSLIAAVAFSPTSDRVAFCYATLAGGNTSLQALVKVAGQPGTFVYDVRGAGPPVKRFPGGGTTVAWGPNPVDQILVWATTSDDTGHVFQFYNQREFDLTGATDAIGQMAVDRSGAYVLTASDDGATRIYDSGGSGPPIETLAGDSGPVRAASFGGFGEYVATSSSDGTARVWQGPRPIPTVSRLDTPTGDPSASSISYEPDGQRIVLTGGGTPSGTGQIIQPGTLHTTATFHAPAGQLFAGAAIGRDGTIAALSDTASGTTGIPAAVGTYDGRTGVTFAQMVPGGGRTLRGAAINPSGSIVALICADGIVELRGARSGRLLHVLSGYAGPIQGIGFSHDGRLLAIAHDPTEVPGDAIAQIWDVASGRLGRSITGPAMTAQIVGTSQYAPLAVALSPDGSELALSGAEQAVDLYDATSGARIKQWSLAGKQLGAFASSLAFSPTGAMLAAGTAGGAYVWQLPSRQQVGAYLQPAGSPQAPTTTSSVVRVGFSANSRYLQTRTGGGGPVGGSLAEWDLDDSGLRVFSISGVTTGAATRDGKRFVTASLIGVDEYRCRLCANLKQLESLAATSVTRGFTPAERARYLKR
jgi:WD40 repeat protein